MLFNSIHFIVFFPIVVLVFFSVPQKYRWILLLAASYYFYMCWKLEYILLIVASTIIDYLVSGKMAAQKNKTKRKRLLIISLVSNLGLLFSFKYFNFFNDSVREMFNYFNIFYESRNFNVLLPVGISFYTFQTLSYTIDVYRGTKEPEKHLGIFALYVAFFPQLVAGPIERSSRLLPQFKKSVNFNFIRISSGLKLILWGFFMKLVIADRLSIYVNSVYNNPAEHVGITFIVATIFFAFQIYCDFAGYSNIAIGTAKVLGYDLMTNFNRPYISKSISEFWSRWHISLSTWFRDYLYIPLGGNRVKVSRLYFNLFIVFVVSGLWHGANWTFVIWGALNGIYLIGGIIIRNIFPGNKQEDANKQKLGIILRVFFTFVLVCFSWIFFRANTVSDAFLIVSKMVNPVGEFFIGKPSIFFSSVLAILFLYITEISSKEWRNTIGLFNHQNANVRLLSYALILILILVAGVFDGGQFIYFQF